MTLEKGILLFVTVWKHCIPRSQKIVLEHQNIWQLFFIYVKVFFNSELKVWLFKLIHYFAYPICL